MPPPPPVFVAPGPVARKRTRDEVTEDPASLPMSTASMGMWFFISKHFDSLSTWMILLWSCLVHEVASPPMEQLGRSGDLCESLHWWNSLTCSSCICFFVFPLFFSLNMCPGRSCNGCVLCCRFIWYLPLPWLWIKRTQKTAAYMGLFNGFPFCFVLSLHSSLFLLSFAFSLSLHFYSPLIGVQEEVSVKKTKSNEDASGLVPYGGDSSDDEEERTRCSKTENS